MKRVTIRGLQREFGLSYATAAGIIGAQRKLAFKRYRLLGAVYSCGMLIFVGLTFMSIHLPHDAQLWMPLALLPLIPLQYYLVTRDSRELILAAACARSAKAAPVR